MSARLDLVFDMETRDPDDALTLCLLATHPRVRLRAVSVNPGSRQQVALVKHILTRLDAGDVPVGARNPAAKPSVSPFHVAWLGELAPREPDAVAHELLATRFAAHPQAVFLTGAPLHNGRLLLNRHPETRIARWVGQGGFAGDSVVPPEHRLPKFAGRETCLTFNFNGDAKAARLLLASPALEARDLVSKNVCHGVVYDAAFHARLEPLADATPGLRLIHEAMRGYLRERPEGKMLHDPLAACVAIERGIATFREVELYREQGAWGARLAPGSGTFITVAVDREAFFRVFAAH